MEVIGIRQRGWLNNIQRGWQKKYFVGCCQGGYEVLGCSEECTI